MIRRRRKPRPVPDINEQVCDRFRVPVCNVSFRVRWLNGTEAPWTYRAVQN